MSIIKDTDDLIVVIACASFFTLMGVIVVAAILK